MKLPTFRPSLAVIGLTIAITLSGWGAHAGKDGVADIVKNATERFDDAAVGSALPLLPPSVTVSSRYQGGAFRTETRKDKIERFKCSQCHNNKAVTAANAAKIAHADVVLVHGGLRRPLSCYTCHDKQARDYLVTEKGVKIDMDHSYQMCGQCHFRQKKDWVGGAHGKRVSAWAGRRVVKNCTSCHDPHSPRFEKRWPVTYSPPEKIGK